MKGKWVNTSNTPNEKCGDRHRIVPDELGKLKAELARLKKELKKTKPIKMVGGELYCGVCGSFLGDKQTSK